MAERVFAGATDVLLLCEGEGGAAACAMRLVHCGMVLTEVGGWGEGLEWIWVIELGDDVGEFCCWNWRRDITAVSMKQ